MSCREGFMSPQTETKASVGFKAGVKDYKLTYYTPQYETKDTDILAAFRVTPQPGVPPEEAGAAQGYENPREATGRIVCANCHLANKPVDIEVPQACRKVKEVGDLMTGEPATEAPVNGGGNYNGPKASQKVTEACKGFLGPDGDWPSSAKAEGSLTARPTRRAGTKVGLSDPTVPSGRAVAQRIKVTLGITG
ncbi:hypothetical protein E3N88_45460 [Mikania micrantha]|uniref:Ribulose bisphosphate carboxylase large chain n=1 Tax=Mikania micrantha TaxID=192012 RepID=A0A5N6L932_9ASTR|nr:hypothetical protein E3N88_45460 [Mikania micrantha]